jgi:hypothetical protein
VYDGVSGAGDRWHFFLLNRLIAAFFIFPTAPSGLEAGSNFFQVYIFHEKE